MAQRLPRLEAALLGALLDQRLGNLVEEAQLAPLAPIDDVRGSAAYRSDSEDVSLVLTAMRRPETTADLHA